MQGDYEAALAMTLKKLRTSDRFESEVRGWLSSYPPAVGDQVIEFLQKHRMLDDGRAAESVVRRRAGYGSERIQHELEKRGASGEVIERSIPRAEEEEERAWEIVQKKYAPTDSPGKAARFLSSRGFPEELVTSTIEKYFGGRD